MRARCSELLFRCLQELPNVAYKLTDEAKVYLEKGSPEAQLFDAVPPEGITMADIKTKLGKIGDVGFRQAMQQKWVSIDKSSGQPVVLRKVETIEDKAVALMKKIQDNPNNPDIEQGDVQQLSKRKLVSQLKWSTFKVSKGPKYALQRKRQATDLTAEMIQKGTWKGEDFKEYNFTALGRMPEGGYLHPLLKVRTQFRKIFTSMGFEEMPTNNYVESSFWNFDALFQPQQHPARDAHDTFFLTGAFLVFHFLPHSGLRIYRLPV